MAEGTFEDVRRIDIRAGTVVGCEEVAAVVNFPPRQIGRLLSEVLVLGLYAEEETVVLVGPDRRVPNAARLG